MIECASVQVCMCMSHNGPSQLSSVRVNKTMPVMIIVRVVTMQVACLQGSIVRWLVIGTRLLRVESPYDSSVFIRLVVSVLYSGSAST